MTKPERLKRQARKTIVELKGLTRLLSLTKQAIKRQAKLMGMTIITGKGGDLI
jgi:hypothetical protein